MNEVREILQSISERFAGSASVKQVFGEPIERAGRTIIPVARVQYGFGGGYGGGEQEGYEAGRPLAGVGGGGGGGVKARPAGVLEITDAETRFIRFVDPVDLVKACVGGVVALLVIRRLLRR